MFKIGSLYKYIGPDAFVRSTNSWKLLRVNEDNFFEFESDCGSMQLTYPNPIGIFVEIVDLKKKPGCHLALVK